MRSGWMIACGLLTAAAWPASAGTTPTRDFIDNGDGTVIHKTTGLTWKRCPEGQVFVQSSQTRLMSETDAMISRGEFVPKPAYCAGGAKFLSWKSASFSVESGWRLPTRNELQSIVEKDAWRFPTLDEVHRFFINETHEVLDFYGSAINTWVFPGPLPNHFWSSEGDWCSECRAWSVSFSIRDWNSRISDNAVMLEPAATYNYFRFVRSGPAPVFNTQVAGKYPPQKLRLDASASISKFGEIVDYTWEIVDAPEANSGIVVAKSKVAELVLDRPKTYIFRLTLTDDKGTTNRLTRSVTLENPLNYRLPAGMTGTRDGRGLTITNPLPYTGLVVYGNSKGETFAELIKASRDAWFSGIYSDASAWWQHLSEMRGSLQMLSAGGLDELARFPATLSVIPLTDDASQATLTIAGEKSAFYDVLQIVFDYAGLYDGTVADALARKMRSRVLLSLFNDPGNKYGASSLHTTLRQGKLRDAFNGFGETALRLVLEIAREEGVAEAVSAHLQQRLDGVGEGVRLAYLDAVLDLVEKESAIAFGANAYYGTPREMNAQFSL